MENLLYPELRAYEREDRARMLQRPRQEPFEFLKWAGILAALVIVVGLTRYSIAGFGLVDRFAVAFANFIVAVPLLVMTDRPSEYDHCCVQR